MSARFAKPIMSAICLALLLPASVFAQNNNNNPNEHVETHTLVPRGLAFGGEIQTSLMLGCLLSCCCFFTGTKPSKVTIVGIICETCASRRDYIHVPRTNDQQTEVYKIVRSSKQTVVRVVLLQSTFFQVEHPN